MTKNQAAARISAVQGQVMWEAGASWPIQRPVPGGRLSFMSGFAAPDTFL